MAYFLRFENITKTFPGVKALDSVSFGVKRGSVHGLVGENGAGKSTLLHILSGVHRADGGKIFIDGKEQEFNHTSEAIAAGVAVIYQELSLVPDMTVAENLLLGHYPNNRGFVNYKEMLERAQRQLDALGVDISPQTKVKHLSVGQRQMIEIGKALLHDAEIITFDEPTSSLSEKEKQQLFKIIRQLKKEQKVIIYVSHRMDEIFDLCDSRTILRDGRRGNAGRYDLALMRTICPEDGGQEITDQYGYESSRWQSPLRLKISKDLELAAPVSFWIQSREIVGFFGAGFEWAEASSLSLFTAMCPVRRSIFVEQRSS